MLLVDFVLLGLGVAGLFYAARLRLHRDPSCARTDSGTRSRDWSTAVTVVSIVIAVFGGARAQDRLGWWVYFMAVALFIAANEAPRRLNKRVLHPGTARPTTTN